MSAYSNDDYSKMDFKALKSRVQELEDEIYRLKRICNENTQSIEDNEGIGSVKKELSGMKSEIKVTAESISSTVEKIEETEKNVSEIIQTAEQISSTVTRYQKENGEYVKGLETKIEQTAEKIESVAKREFLSAEEVVSFDTTDTAGYDNDTVYFDTSTNLYYYYDDITEAWLSSDKPRIESLFEQTSTGFEMTGNVKISGDLITEGTISADRIDADGLKVKKVYSKVDGAFFQINSNVGEFGIFQGSDSGDNIIDNTNCVFGISRDLYAIDLWSMGYNFLDVFSSASVTKPQGIWDFGECVEVTGVNVTACFG